MTGMAVQRTIGFHSSLHHLPGIRINPTLPCRAQPPGHNDRDDSTTCFTRHARTRATRYKRFAPS